MDIQSGGRSPTFPKACGIWMLGDADASTRGV